MKFLVYFLLLCLVVVGGYAGWQYSSGFSSVKQMSDLKKSVADVKSQLDDMQAEMKNLESKLQEFSVYSKGVSDTLTAHANALGQFNQSIHVLDAKVLELERKKH